MHSMRSDRGRIPARDPWVFSALLALAALFTLRAMSVGLPPVVLVFLAIA